MTGRPRTVHLVYPHGEKISSPESIGNHLRTLLAERYEVVLHDWAERETVVPGPGAVLLGHPHPDPGTILRRSARQPGWRRRIIVAPLNLDLAQVAWADALVGDFDLFLAISGRYWFDRVPGSPIAHWLPKLRRLDMAVDPADFPPVKREFGPAGRRRFVYIGHSAKMKNTPYLGQIADLVPGLTFARIGPPGPRIRGVEDLGRVDFATQAGRHLISGFDFVISPSRFDANPTTLLEAMAWGLVPVCTPQSGYENADGIINIPLDDAEGAAALVRHLQATSNAELGEIQQRNWGRLPQYGWDRFAQAVIDAIESDESPSLGPVTRRTRMRLALATITSRYHSPAIVTTRRVGRAVRARVRSARSGLC